MILLVVLTTTARDESGADKEIANLRVFVLGSRHARKRERERPHAFAFAFARVVTTVS